MNTQIILDDNLVKQALDITQLKNVQKLIEFSLQQLIATKKTDALSRAFGQHAWTGNLNAMRTDKNVGR